MSEQPPRTYRSPRANVLRQRDDGFDLRMRIGRQRFVSAIDDLDADRRGVEVAVAFPRALTGMPGAPLFSDKLVDATVLPDEIMRRDLRSRIAELLQRPGASRHARIVQDDAIGLPTSTPLAVIGRGDKSGC